MPSRFSLPLLARLQENLKTYVEGLKKVQAAFSANAAADDQLVEAILKQCPAQDKVSIIRQTIAALQTEKIKPFIEAKQHTAQKVFDSDVQPGVSGFTTLNAATALSMSFSNRELELLKSEPLVLEYEGKKYQIVYTTQGGEGEPRANIMPL